jgi:exopolyphosphatase
LSLRPEFLKLLPHAGLEPQNLITLDDLATEASGGGGDGGGDVVVEGSRWVLVDHNSLQGALGSKYASRVVATIDHHNDENKVPRDTGDEPRIIEKAGSCTSLVVGYLRRQWDSLGCNAANENQVSRLAMATISIDTNNLQDKSKTTRHDVEAMQYLEDKAKHVDRTDLFHEISTAKQDIGSLPLDGILRKDYKEWQENGMKLGIASVVKPLEFLLSKATSQNHDERTCSFVEAIVRFARDRNLSMFSIMTTSTSKEGKFQRELLVCALDDEAARAATRFEDQAGPELKLKRWNDFTSDVDHDPDVKWIKVWFQEAVQQSRKQVAPLLRNAML